MTHITLLINVSCNVINIVTKLQTQETQNTTSITVLHSVGFYVLFCFSPAGDPGFWFGSGTDRRSGERSVRNGSPPAGSRGRVPGGSGVKPPEARRMLPHEANKTTYGEKKQVHTD